jgi:23S rRNA pseudouridine955/2504/2580 synthase
MTNFVPAPKHLKIGEAWRGLTVFEAVRRAFPELTPREVFRKARKGEVQRNAKRCRPLDRLEEGDVVTTVLLRPVKPEKVLPTAVDCLIHTPAGPFRVVWEDSELLVVSKPPFCASHPALGHSGDTLIDRVRAYLGVKPGEAFQPALANRLDVDTSGIVLVGKTRASQSRLGRNLQAGLVEKRYLGLVGGSTAPAGEVSVPLLRRPDSRTRDRRPEGKLQGALTRFRTLERYGAPLRCSLLDVELVTGRTHQIRRHLTHLGHPLAGDGRYGDPRFNVRLRAATGLSRLFLHAHWIRLGHPVTGERLELTTPLPEDLAACLRSLEASEKGEAGHG